MPRQRLLPAPLLFALLGLGIGLIEARSLAAFLLQRLDRWRGLPEPVSMLWMHRLEPLHKVVGPADLPLRIVTVVLLVLALLALGERLNPAFRLWKRQRDPSEEPADDAPTIFRALNGLALSLWLLGALAVTLPGASAVWGLLFSGIPAWTGLLPPPAGPLLQSLLVGMALWWIWAPGTLTGGAGAVTARDKLVWGVLAGLALAPAVLAIYAARTGVRMAAEAYSLADAGPWRLMFLAALLLPVAGTLLVLLCASVLKPRPLALRCMRPPLTLAAGCLIIGALVGVTYSNFITGIDGDGVDLIHRLKLYSSPFRRYALMLFGTQATYSSPPDGTLVTENGPPVVCNGQTMGWVEVFLQQRHYNTQLAYPAFVHLHDCGALEWHPSLTLQRDLDMAEHAPSSVTCSLLMQQLARCDTSSDNREILDSLANPRRFRWPQPNGNRWLGMAYMRFGDPERGKEYLNNAGLTQQDLDQMLRDGPPLSNGEVRGQVTIQKKPIELVRLGLVAEQDWRPLRGECRPFEWRLVMASTYADSDGRFTFKNIPEGRYLLMITGGGIGRYKGNPGVSRDMPQIELDRAHPVADVGQFDIQFSPRRRREDENSRETRAPGYSSRT